MLHDKSLVYVVSVRSFDIDLEENSKNNLYFLYFLSVGSSIPEMTISDPKLMGKKSYLSINGGYYLRSYFLVSLELKPESSHGIIFFAISYSAQEDFLILYLHENMLTLTYRLGKKCILHTRCLLTFL